MRARIACIPEAGNYRCRDFFKLYLRECGSVKFYDSPADLLIGAGEGFDLIISGMYMGSEAGMAGIRLYDDLRKKPATMDTPFLFFYPAAGSDKMLDEEIRKRSIPSIVSPDGWKELQETALRLLEGNPV
ncbi:MAG: hypothetical protein V1813_01210 [Candidatus Aenigmatarchaeota archaeon]